MDGKGRAIDNVMIERLWRTVKYEEVYLKADASVPIVIRAIVKSRVLAERVKSGVSCW